MLELDGARGPRASSWPSTAIWARPDVDVDEPHDRPLCLLSFDVPVVAQHCLGTFAKQEVRAHRAGCGR